MTPLRYLEIQRILEFGCILLDPMVVGIWNNKFIDVVVCYILGVGSGIKPRHLKKANDLKATCVGASGTQVMQFLRLAPGL